MKIPAYVKELLSRSHYEFNRFTHHPDYAAGYTISIRKATPYTYARTLRREAYRLTTWANKVCDGTAIVLDVPANTHHMNQTAVVTIFDPVMKEIEQYISKEDNR